METYKGWEIWVNEHGYYEAYHDNNEFNITAKKLEDVKEEIDERLNKE